MNDLQIEYFFAVARNLSFTKTAEEIYVTQPAVSRQISFLEKELGVVLFDRTNKTTQLTEAGELFLKCFENCSRELQNTKNKANALNQSRSGEIRLACIEGWNISGFFPNILALFSEKYPNIKISLDCYGFRGLTQALKADKVDAILTIDVTLNELEGLQSKILTEIPRIILYSSKHPLAKKEERLSPQEFKDETFFIMSNEEVSYGGDLVKSYCQEYGFTPKIEYVRNIESMNACVQNGMGVVISDSWSREKDNTNFKYLELDTMHKIALAWKTDTNNDEISTLANEMKLILNN